MKTTLAILILLSAGTVMAQRNEGGNRSQPTAADFIKKLDKDNDNKVSKDEFDGPAEHFTQFDANGDGYISASEVPTTPPSKEQGQQQNQEQSQEQRPQRGGEGQSGDFVTRLDKDGDGKVSKDEFDGPSKVFTELDKDEDGYLSKDEAPSGPPPRERK